MASPEPPRCELEFRTTAAGRTLLKELSRPAAACKLRARRFDPIPGGDHRVTASFESDPGEKLFGMGQYQQHLLDLKGCTFELAHRNSQASVPFVLSSAGYGFFWHDPSIGRATFGVNRTEWHAESTRQLDYWITAGDEPAQIVRAYTAATGRPPMMPEHGLGFWQCKLRYWNAEQLLHVAREHIRRGLPLDVIVCDFFHWPRMGDYRFDEEYFPDPRAMVAELGVHGRGAHGLGVAAGRRSRRRTTQEMRENNLLVRSESGVDVQMRFQEPSRLLRRHESCRPAVRVGEVPAELLRPRRPHVLAGRGGTRVRDVRLRQYRYHLGPNLQIGNLYPQLYARGFYEGQVAAGQTRPGEPGPLRLGGEPAVRRARVVRRHLAPRGRTSGARSRRACRWASPASPGGRRTSAGSTTATRSDEGFRELLVRWFQWGAFCPVMRLHGFRLPVTPITHADGRPNCPTGADNEVWSYGEDVYRHPRAPTSTCGSGCGRTCAT